MSRINTNVDSLVALNNLARTNQQLGVSLTRLSTGVRVNSGKDDPAGLISGEFLRSEINSISSAIGNNNRANAVLSTTDSALGEIGDLLGGIRGILTTSANRGVLSQDEINANQSAIDSAISSVNRIANSTQFGGRKLLDGSLGFQLSGVGRTDVANATFSDVQVNLANFNATGSAITVNVTLTTAATQASVALAQTTATIDSTIEVIGNGGSAIVKVGSGQNVLDAINSVSDVTGVIATGSSTVYLNSSNFGSDSFVTVNNVAGGLISGLTTNVKGTDVAGSINGQAFSGKGLNATLKTSNLDLTLTFGQSVSASTATNFTIASGGAKFQLGIQLNSANQINVGLDSFSSASLGNVFVDTAGTRQDRTVASLATGGQNSLTASTDRSAIAVGIIQDAISKVTTTRARIGSIQSNTIETNLRSLQVNKENLSSARSQIVDTDFAEETANLTRLQILVQAGTSSLAIANSRPQSVLSLLSGR
ncbi:flagellin [bacterium]|nr:flagellin [bacterium]